MKILKVVIHKNDLKEKLSPHLKGHFFHTTTPENWLKIMSCGHITGKEVNGSLCPQRVSYGPKRGYICLYDWKNNSTETIEEQAIKLNPLDPFSHRSDPVFIIFKNCIETNIILNHIAVLETEYKERFVPYVECWHAEKIDLDLIETVLITEYCREYDPIIEALNQRKIAK